jgi:NAD(P)-dependent dehydrogenase (short-subunit alcohol dehydrogenase family)
MISALLDTALDRTVLPGYTSIGYRLRAGLRDDAALEPMNGEIVLVTGATSGLGLAAAAGFAKLGAGVRLAVRNEERGERAKAEIVARTGNEDIDVLICDLSDMASVRGFAARFAAATPSLSVLVNNAAVLASERTLSPDGIELTFATNVLGPFLLTKLLIDLLERSAPSRVINVLSGGLYTQRLHVDDLQSAEGDFDGATAYARSKRDGLILTELAAQRMWGTGVVVHAMHPGWVDTPGLEASLPRFHTLTKPLLRSPEQGADTIVWLGAAAEPALSTGGFWHDRRQRPVHRVPWTKETLVERERLWAACERLTDLPAGQPVAAAHNPTP